MTGKHITTLSLEELESVEDRTRADAPEGPSLGPDFWKNARLVYPPAPQEDLTVRLDRDVVSWFKAQGSGYQRRMNSVLRAYVEAMSDGRTDP